MRARGRLDRQHEQHRRAARQLRHGRLPGDQARGHRPHPHRGARLRAAGIRVNVIAPGPTETPMLAQTRLAIPGGVEAGSPPPRCVRREPARRSAPRRRSCSATGPVTSAGSSYQSTAASVT